MSGKKIWERVGVIAAVVGAVIAVLVYVESKMVSSKPGNQNTNAAETINFSCEIRGNVPTTLAQTPRGKIPVIRWVSNYFSQSGFDPQKRCEEVTERFQNYSNQGVLSYITTGIENNQEVICVSGKEGGSCNGTLFTLKPEEKASRVIQQLFDIAYRNGAPLEEKSSASPKIYVDMKTLLEKAPVDSVGAKHSGENP
jgi:hypothetical protein